MVGGALLKRYGKQLYEKFFQGRLKKYWDKVKKKLNPFKKKDKEEKD